MKRTFLVVVEGASAAAAWFEPENIHILLDAAGVKINVTETTNVTPPPDAAIVEKVRELAALRRQAQEEDVKNFTDLSEYVESTAFKRDARISALIEEICALVSPTTGEGKRCTCDYDHVNDDEHRPWCGGPKPEAKDGGAKG